MHAVIMAGGKGSRFWPKSREKMPKHLLDIGRGSTIIQETVSRIESLFQPENILIVTGQSHAGELMAQLPQIPKENILIEPVGRNTAPCIGLAALKIHRKSPDDVMVVLPADHLISDAEQFRHILTVSAEVARKEDDLLTIGIKPTAPETGYGYLEQGAMKKNLEGENIYEVKSVREKPPLAQAEAFLKTGGFYWNSGMFVWRSGIILEAIKRWLPDLYDGLSQIRDAIGTNHEEETIRRVYGDLKSVSIDYGVMEKADNVLLIPGDFGWSDVGSWDALWEVSEKDAQGNVSAVKGTIIAVDTKNSLIHSPRKLITLVGVENLIVVETEDALLICKRGSSQDVKKVVETLSEKHMEEYL